MGEEEGSSIAAQGAQLDDEKSEKGFFGRIIGALSQNEADEEPASPTDGTQRTPPGIKPPGLGNLRVMRVEDVAVPRAEIASVPVDSELHDLVEVFRANRYSRLPVFDGNLDAPVGMIHLKDLALSQGFNGDRPEFDLPAMLRPLLYVPASMPLGVLLQKMQSERNHVAIHAY